MLSAATDSPGMQGALPQLQIASAVTQHYWLDYARAARALFPNVAATRPVAELPRR